MAIIEHRFIRDRSDFFRVLADEVGRARRLEAEVPGLPLFTSLRRQLEAIQQWTAGSREPTKDERKSIGMGALVARELSPASTDELEDFAAKVQEIELYFKHWLDDASWRSLDDSDWQVFFPDDDAP